MDKRTDNRGFLEIPVGSRTRDYIGASYQGFVLASKKSTYILYKSQGKFYLMGC